MAGTFGDLISKYHQNHDTILQLEACFICYSQQISFSARDLLWTWSRFLSAFRGHDYSKSSLKESSSWYCQGLGVLNDKLQGDGQVPTLISAPSSLHPVYRESRISLNHKTLITTHWSAVHVNWQSNVTEAAQPKIQSEFTAIVEENKCNRITSFRHIISCRLFYNNLHPMKYHSRRGSAKNERYKYQGVKNFTLVTRWNLREITLNHPASDWTKHWKSQKLVENRKF